MIPKSSAVSPRGPAGSRRARLAGPALAALALAAAGCGGAGREAPMARTADNTRAADATLVRFEARTSERWSLRREDGSFLCTLPCSYWVRPKSGLQLRLERYDADSLERSSFRVPDQLPAQPGEMVTVSVDRTHGLGIAGKVLAVPTAVIFTFMGVGFTGISIASLATGSENTTTTVNAGVGAHDPESGAEVSGSGGTTATGTAAALGGLAIGVGATAIAVLSWIWFAHDRDGSLQISEPAPGPRAEVRVTPVGVAFRTRSASGALTPAGLAVQF